MSASARESGTSTPASRSANGIWQGRVCEFADRPAFRYRRADAWHCLTWRQADQAARELAAGLLSLGLDRGDRVALLCQTRLEWLLCDVAIAMAGLVSVPIYPSSTPEQCAFILGDSGSRAVIAEDDQQIAKLTSMRASLHAVRVEAAPRADGSEDSHGARSLAELRRAGVAWMSAHAGELDNRAGAVKPSDSFTIIYTSGTTGQPKGVVLTHANLVASCESAVRAFDLRPDDVQYLFLPLAHVLGRGIAWAPIIVGLRGRVRREPGPHQIQSCRRFGPPSWLACHAFSKSSMPRSKPELSRAAAPSGDWCIGRSEWRLATRPPCASRKPPPSDCAGPTVSPTNWCWRKLRKRLGLDRCRFLISGGAPLSSEIAEFFHGAGLLILEGYGLTESTAAAFVNRWNSFRFGTVGPAIDVIDFKFAADGEILLRGPSIFSAYHGNPEATAEAFDAEGWFHTGDIGVVEDGFLRIVDRKKDIIITAGGKNVAPQKLENALKAHSPLVSQAVVFGDRRSYCVALVTPSEPAARQFGGGDMAKAAASPELRAAIEKAVAEVNATLASYETMKGFAILPADFSEASGELTPSLKVKRDVVASKFASTVAGLYGR